jgi:hypothetical protein
MLTLAPGDIICEDHGRGEVITNLSAVMAEGDSDHEKATVNFTHIYDADYGGLGARCYVFL